MTLRPLRAERLASDPTKASNADLDFQSWASILRASTGQQAICSPRQRSPPFHLCPLLALTKEQERIDEGTRSREQLLEGKNVQR